ncbi:protein of unknown function [Brochothrix thermosphacta]|nr:protein of unknown function [Brochothrix thermosphacta]
MGRSASEYHSFANIVADLSALREQYGTERKRVPILLLIP